MVVLLWSLALSLIFAWTQRKELRILALVPLVIWLGSCQASTLIGIRSRRAQFERDLPKYAALVEKVRGVETFTQGNVGSIPLSEADRKVVYSLLAERSTNGVLTVELLTGGGYPLHHSGYLYTSSGVIQPGSIFDSRWPSRTQMAANWFHIGD